MSASAATAVPIVVLFSSTSKVSAELNIGELSFKLFILAVIS